MNAEVTDPPRNAEGLRTDGPTLEEFVAAGYSADNYPPEGYAKVTKDANVAVQPADPGAQQTSDAPPQPAAGEGGQQIDQTGQGAAEPAAQAAFEGLEHLGSTIGEDLMQRLRYFENLVEHQWAHIKELAGRLGHAGHAAPAMPSFPALKSPLGHYDPNDRT